MWTKVIPFPSSSLYISYKTTYFHNILMKSIPQPIFMKFSPFKTELIRVYHVILFASIYDLNTNVNS